MAGVGRDYKKVLNGLLQALNKSKQVRHFHTTRILCNKSETNSDMNNSQKVIHVKAIRELFKDRLAPVKVFSDKLLASCSNILDIKERLAFLNDWGDMGGIYIIQYKHDSLVYYIGRTNKFSNRFRSHIKHRRTDKFHLFADMVGWDNFRPLPSSLQYWRDEGSGAWPVLWKSVM